MTTPRFVVAEDARAFSDAVASVERDGFELHRGWNLPDQPWELRGLQVACAGRIADQSDRDLALAAAARGAALIIAGPIADAMLAPLAEDLRRIGEVEHRRGDGLDAQQRRLLALLGEGLSLGEAAARLHISRRTADRRLASARAILGVRTTAQAVVAHSDEASRRRS